MEDQLLHSDTQENFSTGSRRDTQEGKGMYNLIPPLSLHLLARLYQKGAIHYGDNNWLKGQPMGRTISSLRRHLNEILLGKTDEDHMASLVWNAIALLETRELIKLGYLPPELNDMGLFGKVWTDVEECPIDPMFHHLTDNPKQQQHFNDFLYADQDKV